MYQTGLLLSLNYSLCLRRSKSMWIVPVRVHVNRDIESLFGASDIRYASWTSWTLRTDRLEDWPPLNLQLCISVCSLIDRVGKGFSYTLDLAFEKLREGFQQRIEPRQSTDIVTYSHFVT